MSRQNKSREQLVAELKELRREIARLKNVERNYKRAEEDLKESEGLFRATFEHAAVGMDQVDLQGRLLRVNKRLCELLGYQREELIQRPLQEITVSEDSDKSFELLHKLQSGEIDEYTLRKRYLRKDGSFFWADLFVSLVRDAKGRPLYYIGVIQDITDRKRAEDALQREKERFRTLVEELPLGISLINPDGNWTYVNPTFVKIFGYDLKDVPRGKDWFYKAFPDEKLRKQAISLWFADQKEYDLNVARPRKFQVRCKDGLKKTVTITSIALKTGEQFVLCEDITERMRAEEENLKSEKLQAAMETAGAASHEINQPLQVIMARAELALMTRHLTGSLRKDLQDMLENTVRIAQITKKLNRITEFKTTDYVGSTQILDIERSSKT